jgi:hypothetical protein
MHAYDRASFRRGLLAIGVLLALAGGVVVTTDEATSTAAMRLARLSALSPIVSALALLGIAGHARARGELAALEALGAPPWRALRGAEWAGMAFAVAAVVALCTPWSDVTSLLPRVEPLTGFVLDGRGAHVATAGLFVEPSGAIHLAASREGAHAALRSPWIVVPCLAPVALLVPAWALTPMPLAWRLASSAFTGALLVTALHAVAVGRLPALLAGAASVPLVATLWSARRGA